MIAALARRLLAPALALLLASCHAAPAFAETYLYTGGWSKHFSGKDHHETHNVFGVQRGGLMVSYFVNSYRDEGAFGGYTLRHQGSNYELGMLIGLVYAYRECYGGEGEKALCPLVLFSATYTRYRLQPQVALWGNAAVVTLRWRLD